MPVNKTVLGLQDPTTLTSNKYLSFLCAIFELIGAVTGER